MLVQLHNDRCVAIIMTSSIALPSTSSERFAVTVLLKMKVLLKKREKAADVAFLPKKQAACSTIYFSRRYWACWVCKTSQTAWGPTPWRARGRRWRSEKSSKRVEHAQRDHRSMFNCSKQTYYVPGACQLWDKCSQSGRNGSRGGGGSPPPKTYESNFIHHDFVQLRKQHSR